ncbi:DNA mismatch repair protein MutS [Tannockella kyphosi]|uniref:DNA mismatch repair protein MutS n=1 Tax=Tannockella kyphosi TaxID=2899121 RepID=UPI002013666F|nr:DNA mismatch repair protein MutS [Tannockella kyphosi]
MKPKYSPMMMQYLSIKEQHPNDIVMFRLGDFYEMFFDDALVVSKELEIALTGKNAGAKERVPMCGVPFHSASGYIQRLIELNHRVAIVEQLSEPGKGIVERGVVQIVTPGTIFDDSLANKKNNFIAAFYEFDFVYCLSFCDITTGEFKVVNIEKNEHNLINQLQAMNVLEVVCLSNQQRTFGSCVVSCFDKEETQTGYDKIFDNLSDLKQHKVCNLLLNYLLDTQKRELSHLQNIEVIDHSAYITMDLYTKKALELTTNTKNNEKYGSLFWLLDQTKTAMGSRYLKQWIERPLVKKAEIEKRLDIVEILNLHFIQRESLKEVLKEVYDLERLSAKIAFGNLNARDMKWIGNTLKTIPEIKEQLLSIPDHDVQEIATRLIDVSYITKAIDDAIIDNPPLSIKEGSFIKDGFDEELDELRYIRNHGKNWLATFEQQERERTGIKGLKVGYNRVFGYYIEVTKANIPFVKDEFEYTRKQSLSNAERFITPELKEMETKIIHAQDKSMKLEYSIFQELREFLKKDVHLLQDIAKTIAMIDVYQSLACISSDNSYVRPIFNEQKTIEITQGRHGVIEKVMEKGRYVSNDVSIQQLTPVQLITGPNMGGKSTYMRQVALSVIMAQIGCFVPATSAKLPIFDQVFTRIGASDDLVAGQSTFMVEMLEANNALNFATENSLILFDEIGRGTATFDGMAIAQAMIEHIASKIKCITLFSTHYHELTFLSDQGLGIENVHASAIVENDKLVFLYQVLPGCSNKSYGIHVASLAKLPDSIISRANVLLNMLETNNIEVKLVEQPIIEIQTSQIEKQLEQIDPMALSPLDALSTLIELKKMIGK